MVFTAHGHHIMGTTLDGAYIGDRARCGGPGLCKECSEEAERILAIQTFGGDAPRVIEHVVDLGPELFGTEDLTVLSYKGLNYYMACGEIVTGGLNEGATTCVKRVNHPSWEHEDYDGTRKDSSLSTTETLSEVLRREARSVLRRTGLNEEEIFNALNAFQSAGLTLSKT